MVLPRDRRVLGKALLWLGLCLSGLGALITLGGSVAPWVLFSVFGVPLAAPGLLFAGAWSALAGVLALSRLRRTPLLVAACGVVALLAGTVGGKEAPRVVAKQLLSLRLRLAPVNARLEQVSLAPIEPFGELTRNRDITGPGPAWVVCGGGLLLLGGLATFFGDRWQRACPQCQEIWSDTRLPEMLHCPGCGFKRTDSRQCSRCFQVALATDKHCTHCGNAL